MLFASITAQHIPIKPHIPRMHTQNMYKVLTLVQHFSNRRSLSQITSELLPIFLSQLQLQETVNYIPDAYRAFASMQPTFQTIHQPEKKHQLRSL